MSNYKGRPCDTNGKRPQGRWTKEELQKEMKKELPGIPYSRLTISEMCQKLINKGPSINVQGSKKVSPVKVKLSPVKVQSSIQSSTAAIVKPCNNSSRIEPRYKKDEIVALFKDRFPKTRIPILFDNICKALGLYTNTDGTIAQNVIAPVLIKIPETKEEKLKNGRPCYSKSRATNRWTPEELTALYRSQFPENLVPDYQGMCNEIDFSKQPVYTNIPTDAVYTTQKGHQNLEDALKTLKEPDTVSQSFKPNFDFKKCNTRTYNKEFVKNYYISIFNDHNSKMKKGEMCEKIEEITIKTEKIIRQLRKKHTLNSITPNIIKKKLNDKSVKKLTPILKNIDLLSIPGVFWTDSESEEEIEYPEIPNYQFK